jgi:hypothetical protein
MSTSLTRPADPETVGGRRTRRRRTVIIVVRCVLALVILGGAGITARLFVWRDLPPPPPRVDAIIELGGPGLRDRVALGLARSHRAPILVQSTTEVDAARGPVPSAGSAGDDRLFPRGTERHQR